MVGGGDGACRRRQRASVHARVEVRSAEGVEEFWLIDTEVVDTTGAATRSQRVPRGLGSQPGLETVARCVGRAGGAFVIDAEPTLRGGATSPRRGGPVVRARDHARGTPGSHRGGGGGGSCRGRATVSTERATAAMVGVLDQPGGRWAGCRRSSKRFGEAGNRRAQGRPRDLAACVAGGEPRDDPSRHARGLRARCTRFMGTGGIGGVHRGFVERAPSISADLASSADPRSVVSGSKSLLHVLRPRSCWRRSACRVGDRTDEPPLSDRAPGWARRSRRASTTPTRRARTAGAHWELGGAALLLARDPDDGVHVAALIEEARPEPRARGIHGQAELRRPSMHEHSDERMPRGEPREPIVANARPPRRSPWPLAVERREGKHDRER